MRIFKLFFEHDMVLEKIQNPGQAGKPSKTSSLEDFLKPVPTYSRFYLSGTVMDEPRFGLTAMPEVHELCYALQIAMDAKRYLRSDGAAHTDLWELVRTATTDQSILAVRTDAFACPLPAMGNRQSFREQTGELIEMLDGGHIAVYIEKAHHGADLHLYSKANIYPALFQTFKPFLSDELRFFSINAKRSRSERLFYFETWTLASPPHGFEEVFKGTTLG